MLPGHEDYGPADPFDPAEWEIDIWMAPEALLWPLPLHDAGELLESIGCHRFPEGWPAIEAVADALQDHGSVIQADVQHMVRDHEHGEVNARDH